MHTKDVYLRLDRTILSTAIPPPVCAPEFTNSSTKISRFVYVQRHYLNPSREILVNRPGNYPVDLSVRWRHETLSQWLASPAVKQLFVLGLGF